MTEADVASRIERIHTFDIVRGGAIIGILFIHRILWDFFFPNFNPGDEIPPYIGILYIFITMAGIFYVISGSVYSFMIYKRLSTNKITPKQVVLGGWVTGLLMVIYSYVFRIFLLRFLDDTMPLVIWDPTLENSTGILPYLVLYGKLPEPLVSLVSIVGVETLAMIGYTIIFVSTILGLAYKHKGIDNSKFIYTLMFIIGASILLLSPILRTAFGEMFATAFQSGDFLFAFFTIPLTNGMMPIFPHLSYGCFGAMIGLAIARQENSRKFLLTLLVVTILLLIVGILFSGDYTGLPGQEPYTLQDNIELLARKLVQLGFFFFLFLLGLGLVDYKRDEIREKWARRSSVIKLFGKLALTVYMLEGLVAAILQRTVGLVWVDWNATFLNVIIFGLLNVLIWLLILKQWQKVKFKGSLEWCLVWLVTKLSKKPSSRFRD